MSRKKHTEESDETQKRELPVIPAEGRVITSEDVEKALDEQSEPQQVEKTAEVETPTPQQPREEAAADGQPEPEAGTTRAKAEPSVPKFIVKSDSETVEGEYSEAEAHDIRRKREIVRPLDNWRVEPAN